MSTPTCRTGEDLTADQLEEESPSSQSCPMIRRAAGTGRVQMSSIGRDRLILLSPLAVVGVLAVVPIFDDGPTVCPFALCTGMACPGCGMTRAASMLIRGDLTSALHFHPLVLWTSALAGAGWIWFVLGTFGKVQPLSRRVVNGLLTVTLLALVAVWIGRLISGTLPPV